MTRRYFDVTLTFTDRLPIWPGDTRPSVARSRTIADGNASNVSRLETCVHTGTHVDAPNHFIDGAAGVESLALDALVGPALVVMQQQVDAVTADSLAGLGIPPGTERLLIRTRNSALWDDPAHRFFPDFVAVSADGAGWLVDHGVRLVGVDYISVEAYRTEDYATHRTLLGAGVVIVEGLDLRAIEAGSYEMACLPMKIGGADGAPARVVLWQEA